jgi:AraC-like DNA-binding protein
MQTYDLLHQSSLYIRRAWDATMPVNWCLPERIIFDYELLCISEGEAIITIDDIEYGAGPGDLFLFKPMQVHAIQGINGTALRQPHVHFDFFYQQDSEEVYIPVWSMRDPGEDIHFARPDVTGPDLLDIPNKIIIRENKRVEALIFELIKECESISRYSVLKQKSILFQILALILEGLHDEEKQQAGFTPDQLTNILEQARQHLAAHLSEPLSIDDLADNAGFSRNHFAKLFRQQFGQAPGQYHMMLRIQRAKEMLAGTDTTITDIAQSLGFDSIYSFSRAFKRETGISPLYFRQLNG